MFGKKKKKPLSSAEENALIAEKLKHVAFIMDGNGRWAKKRGMPREMGHRRGAEIFERVVRHCFERGVETVTVYAFSTENWSRPQNEVDAIMGLLERYLEYAEKKFSDYDSSLVFLGDKAKLSSVLQEKIAHAEAISRGKTHRLNIALNYGARDEIVHAFRTLAQEGKEEITAKDISDRLYTAGCSDPDLIVRTGGDYRISNFLLWQAAYAELYFTPTLWPDFTEDKVDEAITEFLNRHRRYGGL